MFAEEAALPVTLARRGHREAMGSRSCFLAGFVVGTATLYVFLGQVGLDQNVSVLRTLSSKQHRQQQAEEEKVWKKERSALFNLEHPHHSGESLLVLTSLLALSC